MECEISGLWNEIKIPEKTSRIDTQQLAAQLGITKSVVSFYELQARSPSPEVLTKLAQIFHVSTDYLLGLDEKDISALRTLVNSLRKN